MKPTTPIVPVSLTALLALGAAAVQDMAPPTPLDQHAWLQQLVGEWDVVAEATMEPGSEPMRMESTESVRSIGGLWILGEGKATFDGSPFTSILTLGYDPAKEAFVGTWIDTMQTHMWNYAGSLDEERKVLTLATEGPSFGDPTQTANYRDAIEIKGPDHKVLTSSVLQDDGTWNTFLRAEYRRKR
jgi:hypothetical protein